MTEMPGATYPRSRYAAVRLMVVRHPEDRECDLVLKGYRQLLRDDDDSLIDMPLDTLLGGWKAVVGVGQHMDWLREFGKQLPKRDKEAVVRAGKFPLDRKSGEIRW